MGLFTKKKKTPEPIIGLGVQSLVAIRASEIIEASMRAYEQLCSVPGLIDYCKTTLIPSVVPSIMMGNIEKALGIVASNPVVGPLVADIARIVKDKSK